MLSLNPPSPYPAHLFPSWTTYISLLFLLKVPHPDHLSKTGISGVFFLLTEWFRVIQACNWNDLRVGVFPKFLGFKSLVQWPPHYVGRGDSREENGFSEKHSFWSGCEERSFSWQIIYCFHSVCVFPFSLPLCHWSMTVKETSVLITSVVLVRRMSFIVFEVFGTTLRSGLSLKI